MAEYRGKAIVKGVAIGKLFFYSKEKGQVRRTSVTDTNAEKARYESAKTEALRQLGEIYEKALKEVGEENAAIFEVHQMFLEGDEFNESVISIIETEKVNAEYAVARTGDNLADMFAAMDDDYFKARSADMKDISERVLNVLMGGVNDNTPKEPVILIAEDLAPSETVQMDKNNLLSFVTRLGSSNSHTAILARNMDIPALIGIDIDKAWSGKQAIVDGNKGLLIIDPDSDTLSEYEAKLKEQKEEKELLKTLKGKEDVTLDGKHIKLYANIGGVGDVADVLKNDAKGIGLFRSEFLYLESDDFPTEEQQFEAYRKVAQMMAGKKVIIRTLDIGADKQVDYFNLDKEDNPALGYRAIRICLQQPEIFRTQLRALLRASAFGNIAIMYPMIISEDEVLKIKEISSSVKEELKAEGIPFDENIEEGIMIETPAAAVISDKLAKLVDFFSIGTNDLTQYTLAVDRQNAKLEAIADTHHEAVLRLIELVCKNAHEAGIWAGICGELGSDLELTERFMKMGVDELSVSSARVLPVRQKIRQSKAYS